jgi:hypothetical protein
MDLLYWFQSLPCHFIMTALERRDVDDDGKVAYGPDVTPALMSQIPGFVNVLVHTVVVGDDDDPTYAGWTVRHDKKYRAKDHYGVLPRRMPIPTFDRIYRYIREEMTKDNDPVLRALIQKQEEAAAKAA